MYEISIVHFLTIMTQKIYHFRDIFLHNNSILIFYSIISMFCYENFYFYLGKHNNWLRGKRKTMNWTRQKNINYRILKYFKLHFYSDLLSSFFLSHSSPYFYVNPIECFVKHTENVFFFTKQSTNNKMLSCKVITIIQKINLLNTEFNFFNNILNFSKSNLKVFLDLTVLSL